ncbi:hypothetical protein [Konateibacter massiliensis]|uniref:hypothetical protein n=1 Tax=Konateibacter massiliensis TaxID=2002841 RepID=UPI000C15E766|nr:hypothetical protein [Konateibacter massiliensis]
MKTLYFENVEELCCDIADKFESLNKENYSDLSIIAKYEEAREIIKGLICFGYDIASIDIHREEFEDYWDEYVISLNFDGIWCEKFKRNNNYVVEASTITYISNECNSKIIPYVKSDIVYAFEIGEEVDEDYECGCEKCNCNTLSNTLNNKLSDGLDNFTDWMIMFSTILKSKDYLEDMLDEIYKFDDLLCGLYGRRK